MRRVGNLDTLTIQADAAYPQTVDEIRVRRGDALALDFSFVHSGDPTTVDLGASPPMTFVVKRKDLYDSNPIFSASGFPRSIEGDLTLYKGALSLVNGSVDKLLGVDNITQGEIVTIECDADVSGSKRRRAFLVPFTLTTGKQLYFTVGGTGAAPTAVPGYDQVIVAIAANDTATTIAAAIVTALGAFTSSGVAASSLSNVVTYSTANGGIAAAPVADPNPQDSGFVMTVLQAASVAGTNADVAEVELMAELSVDVTGVGRQTFAKVPFFVENNLRRGAVSAGLVSNLLRYDTLAIASGALLKAVTFASAMPSTSYWLRSIVVKNIVDGTPLNIWPGLISTKTTAGFTVNFNAATDTANYVLEYVADHTA